MRPTLLLSLLLLGGCFAPKYDNGDIRCDPYAAHPCPDGLYCAIDHSCWKSGQMPPHVSNVVLGSGGGSTGTTANRAFISIGQPAGLSRGSGSDHSLRFGVLGGTTVGK
jgi:hypothetical protein